MAGLQFRVLGPVRVTRDGTVLWLSAPIVILLAALLASPNQVVPDSSLIDWIWGSKMPDDPQAALRGLVSRTRRLIGQDLTGVYASGVYFAGDDVIETHPWGHRLHADPGCLDLLRFEHLRGTAESLAAEGRMTDAAANFDKAIALWREPFLANVHSPALRRELSPEFTGRYLETVEARAALYLRLGRPDIVIRDLPGVIRAHPHRERATGMLMVALANRGRHKEALNAYNVLRRRLLDDLGSLPGPEVQDACTQILRRHTPPEWPPAAQDSRRSAG